MSKIIQNFKNISYGPAPEDSKDVMSWINSLNNPNHLLFIIDIGSQAGEGPHPSMIEVCDFSKRHHFLIGELVLQNLLHSKLILNYY